MVAADGTINWFVPNFDSPPLFGAFLDPEDGGFCRFGPARASLGQQLYLSETAALVTTWRGDAQESGALELTDVMAWPADERPEPTGDQRAIVKRLRAREASIVSFEVWPRWGFGGAPEEVRATPYAATFHFAAGQLAVWTSFPVRIEGDTAVADLTMGSGDEIWAVIGWNSRPDDWTRERAAEAFAEALGYWRAWVGSMKWNAILTGFAVLIQLPTLRCRFVTGSTVALSWNRWNCLQYAVTRIVDRYVLVIVPPNSRCGTNTGNCATHG
jgi:hypothetical protein